MQEKSQDDGCDDTFTSIYFLAVYIWYKNDNREKFGSENLPSLPSLSSCGASIPGGLMPNTVILQGELVVFGTVRGWQR